MDHTRTVQAAISLLTVVLLTACASQPAPTASPTITNTAAFTATPTPPPTSTLTATTAPTRPAAGGPTAAQVVITAPPTTGFSNPGPTPTTVPGTLIEDFTASPMEIDPGESFTLSWKVRSDIVTELPILYSVQLGVSESVPLQGEKTVTTSTDDYNSIRFSLSVQSNGLTEQAWIQVKLRCLDNWFFPNSPDICPRTSALVTQGVIQHFEGGMMVWMGESNPSILVLFDNGYRTWQRVQDTWQSGMPESDPSLVPPAGYFQPVRGFGKAWRETTWLRDGLGWATETEQTFTVSYQCDSSLHYSSCYIQIPEGVARVGWGQVWELWKGPGA